MIFYFSGTGNSYRAALRLAAETGDSHIVSIARAVQDGGYSYHLGSDEPVGFIFPVYYYNIPSLVQQFVHLLGLTYTEDPYVYAVLVCGERTGNAADQLKRELEAIDLRLEASFGVVMPNNSIPWYAADTGAHAEEMMRNAFLQLADIGSAIRARSRNNDTHLRGSFAGLHTRLATRNYERARTTDHFSLGQGCTACGICTKVCPEHIIRLGDDGRPQWTEKECCLCLACMNACPKQNILYDGSAGKGGQYFDSEFRSFLLGA